MNASCRSFIDQIVALSTEMQTSIRETEEYFSPDEAPITALFAALGDRIAEDFDSTDLDVNQQLFRLIEGAMLSGDESLVTAVATGLIEAMVSVAVKKKGLWKRISLMLGTRSLHHAQAWMTP